MLTSTGPIPSMLTSVAPVVCQVSVVGWPGSTVLGLADNEAVGAVALGGGGGGGAASFFGAHAARNMIVASANSAAPHLIVVVTVACFTRNLQFLVRLRCGVLLTVLR